MTLESIKSFDEHHEFMNEISRLMFNFSYHWRLMHSDENISEIILNRTKLFQLYEINGKSNVVQTWNELMSQAEQLIGICSCELFELEMFGFAKDFIKECAKRTYATSIKAPENYKVGSLHYDAPSDRFQRNQCNFHIANSVSPKSIFTDYDHLPNCFLKLMDDSEKEYGYDTLRTFSWLNSRPRWLELFPQEWQDNLEEPTLEILGNYAYWGQLVTSRGTLNEQVAKYVRENHKLKYKPRISHCSYSAMRTHLKNYLNFARA